MDEPEFSVLAQRFLLAYSNLPLKTREEVLVVVNKQPISWKVAYVEITKRTDLGKEILKNIKKLGLFD